MNTVVESINAAGRAFVDVALPMLIQSGALILILLIVDVILRRRVRAVFRYWIWMLVLVKLVLPPSLGSPVSIGTWFGATLEVPTAALFEPEPAPPVVPEATELSPAVSALLSPPDPWIAQPPVAVAPAPAVPIEVMPPTVPKTNVTAPSPAVSLSWQGLILLVWSAVAFALTLLLVQRAFFVRGLIGQAGQANRALLGELEDCRRRIGLRRAVGLRLSPNATSPAVCGLFRPVILIPQSLAPRLHAHDLEAVLLHELAHIERGDLWVNLAQTVLQIAYFYNPLVWLANAMIRRTREQAVDETVLVAMGATARQYPETLVNIAKLAFTRRPALSLRLIGVVESKSALTGRIRHMLSRPLPKTARLGLLGLVIVFLIAAVLLPMAKADQRPGVFHVEGGPLDLRLVGICADGDDELYDPNGESLGRRLGVVDASQMSWGQKRQRRDFVFELPADHEPLLMADTQVIGPADGRRYGLGFRTTPLWLYPREGGTLVVISAATLARTHEVGFLRRRETPIDKVDLTLRYYYGPPRDAVCTFTGPFVPGKPVRAHKASGYELTFAQLPYSPDSGELRFHISPPRGFDGDTTVLLYDTDGRRYPPTSPWSLDRGQRQLFYRYQGVPLDRIKTITMGEKPHATTFRNVVIHSPARPARDYPAYLDVMAERLGRQDLSSRQLAAYQFQSSEEAIAVLDVLQDRGLIQSAIRSLSPGARTLDFSTLDPQVLERVHATATRWTQGPDLCIRACGIQLGLLGRWPEFFDEAMQMLGADYAHLAPVDRRDLTRDLAPIVLTLLQGYRSRLSPDQFQRLADFQASQRDLPVLPPTKESQFKTTLPNGATVELLGICDYPGKGKTWWRADGSPLEDVPYDRIDQFVYTPDTGKAPFDVAFRIRNLPEDCDVQVRSPDTQYARSDNPLVKAGEPQEDLKWLIVGAEPHQTTCTIHCDIAGSWRAVARGSPGDIAGRSEGTGVTIASIQEIGDVIAVIQLKGRVREFFCRVVAVMPDGTTRESWPSDMHWSDGEEETLYIAASPLSGVRELQLQVRPVTTVEFRNVPLRPDLKTDVEARVLSHDVEAGTPPMSDGGPERQVVLPDRQPVILDLATGSLFPLPPVGPEPEKVVQVLREMGKGDVLYDVDLGDRTLVFLRDGRSEPAGEEPGEPPIRGYLIKNPPETITVVTKEGRRYKVTILAADGNRCTLRYSPQPLDRGPGGGTLAEPGKAATPPQSKPSEPNFAVQLPNGVAVELLAYSRLLGPTGLEWWTPKGERTTIPDIYEADVEGHGTLLALRVEPEPEYVLAWSYQPPDIHRSLKIWRMNGSNIRLAALGEGRGYVNLEVYARVQDPPRTQIIRVDQRKADGSIHIDRYGDQKITELTAVGSDAVEFTLGATAQGPRVVAVVDTSGSLYPVHLLPAAPRPPESGRRPSAKEQRYQADVPLSDLGGIVIEGRAARGGEVRFRNLSLMPEQPTRVQVEVSPEDPGPMWFAGGLDAKLSTLADALSIYAQSHAGRYPADLSELRGQMGQEDHEFIEQHMVYLGAGKTATGPAGTVLAYAKTLLPFGFGTYVLYADRRVEFELPAKLEELGILAKNRAGSASGALELRVAPTRDVIVPDIVAECRKALAEGHTPTDGRYLWVPLRPGTEPPLDTIIETREGRTWLLVYGDDRRHAVVPAQGWHIAHIARRTDRSGRPMLVLRFDDAGEQRISAVTEPHEGDPLAVIVGGFVVSAATVPQEREGLRCAVIAGDFTEQELDQMTTVLRRHMIDPPVGTDGDFRPVTLPRDGVTIELLGICEYPSVDKSWWRPDGSLLAERPYDDDYGKAFPKKGERGYKFAVRLRGLAGREVDARIDPSSRKTTNGGALFSTSRKDGRENAKYRNGVLDEVIVWQGAAFDEELDSCDIRVGVCLGQWGEYRYETDKPDDPVEWAVFKNVALCPGRKADVHVMTHVGGTLEFRIAPKPEEVGSTVVKQYEEALAKGERPAGGTLAWFEVRPGVVLVPDQITREQGGKSYVLLRDDVSHKMLADGRVKDIRETSDSLGRPAIELTLDDGGAQRLQDLAQKNVRHYMAVALEGRVISIPFITAPLFLPGGRLPINGQFTPEEVTQVVTALKKSMVAPPSSAPPPSGMFDSQPATAEPYRHVPQEISGIVVDPNGNPVAGAQVALGTEDKGVTILTPRLVPTDLSGKTSEIVETDADGWFSFSEVPEEFMIVASHETGFARLDGRDFRSATSIRLEPWGQIEGTLHIGRAPAPNEVMTLSFGTQPHYAAFVFCDHRADTEAGGRFVFRQVVPGWLDIGHVTPMERGSATWSSSRIRQTIQVKPGETLKVAVGGAGRPIVGTLVLPQEDERPAGLTWGPCDLSTTRPAWPKPAGYDQMTGAQRGQAYSEWTRTPQGRAHWEAVYHDPNRRMHSFQPGQDSAFRIEDVIPGQYQVTVYLEEPAPRRPVGKLLGPYSAVIEVPPMEGTRSDRPLDLGAVILENGTSEDVGQVRAAAVPVQTIERTSAGQLTAGETESKQAVTRDLGKEIREQEPPPDRGVSGRVLDPSGNPTAGAQVALITTKARVTIRDGWLEPPQFGREEKAQVIETDAQGRFRFESEPNEGFSLVAAHKAGFRIVEADAFKAGHEVRLELWGRIEGRVAEGREPVENKIWMGGLPNETWLAHKRDYRYETLSDGEGRFTFEKVPPGRFEVGYLLRNGDWSSSLTSRTPVIVKSGETAKVTLGGEGRPVIGRFVPPEGYSGSVYFGAGLRALQTHRPDPPRPSDYDQMTKRQQQEWTTKWWAGDEARALSNAMWSNPRWRAYTFRVNRDGSFRIEDVIPGEYNLTVYLEESVGSTGGPAEIGGYHGTIVVPAMAEAASAEPLDLGNLTLHMRSPLHVGDMAPLFEARSLDGKDIRLIDYRGRFVLLSFWSPTSHMELGRLKELHETHGSSGKFQIIGLGGGDTLSEVEKYVAEHGIAWPEVYVGEKWDEGIAARYGLSGSPYILLVDPEGKIIATWLRGEKLTAAVRDAVERSGRVD